MRPNGYTNTTGREAGSERSWAEPNWQRSHRRSWERRSIEVFTPHPQLLSFAHAKQAYRITHERCQNLGGAVQRSYGLSSLPAQLASPRQVPELQRGHWQVESANHYRRDTTFAEDSSRVRTGHGPANAAALNNLALLLSQRPFETVPTSQTYYAVNRDAALQLLLAPA